MADLIETWLPRVGDTGDDKYAWPEDDVFEAGPTYNTPPLWSDLNDASARGLNQIIGVVNKFIWLNLVGGYASAGLGLPLLNYVTSDSVPLASLFTTLKAKIDSIRAANNQSAFSWTTSTFASDDVALRQTILEFRKALATSELWFPQSLYNLTGFYRTESPMFTVIGSGDNVDVQYGKSGGAIKTYTRGRMWLTPRLSNDAWPEGITPASLILPWKAVSVTGAAADRVMECWRFDDDITPITYGDFAVPGVAMVDSKVLTDIVADTIYTFVETLPERLAVDYRCYELLHNYDRTNYDGVNANTYVRMSLNDTNLKVAKVVLD